MLPGQSADVPAEGYYGLSLPANIRYTRAVTVDPVVTNANRIVTVANRRVSGAASSPVKNNPFSGVKSGSTTTADVTPKQCSALDVLWYKMTLRGDQIDKYCLKKGKGECGTWTVDASCRADKAVNNAKTAVNRTLWKFAIGAAFIVGAFFFVKYFGQRLAGRAAGSFGG